MLTPKWITVLRTAHADGRDSLMRVADRLLNTPDVGRVTVDERVRYPELGVADDSDIVGIVHAQLDEAVDAAAWAHCHASAFAGDGYLTTTTQRRFPDGAPLSEDFSSGVWRLGLLRRRESLTPHGFAERWRTGHAPLVPIHHPGTRILQQDAVLSALDAQAPRFDGLFQALYPTYLDFRDRRFASEESMHAVSTDLDEFVDQSRTELLFSHRLVIRS